MSLFYGNSSQQLHDDLIIEFMELLPSKEIGPVYILLVTHWEAKGLAEGQG